MNYEQPSVERHRHTSVSARGAVILRGGGREIHGRGVVVDETALEVRCQLGFTLLSMAGISVEIEMRLDGAAGTWFIAHGKVAHVRAANHSLIIALDVLPLPLATLLADDDAHARVALIEVMVVDRDRARCTRVSDAFRAEGCHVVEVGTALEALDAITSASFATTVFAVADTVPESAGIDLRDYLETAHATALIVGIGDPEWTPTRARLDPSDAEALLRARVKALLLGPSESRDAVMARA